MGNNADTVILSDKSNGGARSLKWRIYPQNPRFGPDFNYFFRSPDTTSTAVVNFVEPGQYDVCLTASNKLGKDSLCREDYITVGEAHTVCNDNLSRQLGGVLTDEGGFNGDYSNNQNCSFTINPCADQVVLTLEDMNLQKGHDFLRIYDVTDAQGTPLWDTTAYGSKGITGRMLNPAFESNLMASSGAVYVEFETDGSETRRGFELQWEATPNSGMAPEADFAVQNNSCLPRVVHFDNQTSGEIGAVNHVEYEWYLDTSQAPVATTQDLDYHFNTYGTKTLTLVAKSCVGADTVRKSFDLSPQVGPEVEITASDDNPAQKTDLVRFGYEDLDCINYAEWDFSPASVRFRKGTDKNSEHPWVTFNEPGCYDLTLTLGIDRGNVTDTIEVIRTCVIESVDVCNPRVANLNSDMGISRIVLNTIDNGSPIGEAAYSNYTDIATTLQKGAEYPVTVERNTSIHPINRKVWIDWDDDGDFRDAGELVGQSNGGQHTISWTDTISVPDNIATANTKMRVGVSYGNDANTPCGVNDYGEFEDYRIRIIEDETAPELTLKGDDTVSMEACHSLNNLMLGARATDNSDGNITHLVEREGLVDTATSGIYELKYTVADSSGNEASPVYLYVKVTQDTTAPSLSLKGLDTVTLGVGDDYQELGYVADDNCSGIRNVETETPNTSRLDTFHLTYTAYDHAGNATSVNRVVEIIDTVAPSVQYAGDTVTLEVFNELALEIEVSDNYYGADALTQNWKGGYFRHFPNGVADSIGVFDAKAHYRDPSGNEDSIRVMVKVVDSEAPQISLKGRGNVNLARWEVYEEEGVRVSDNYDRNPDTIMGGNYFTEYVNAGFPEGGGIFEITYQAEDQSGNESDIVRRSIYVSGTSGIDPSKNEKQVEIFPNPTNGKFTLNLSFREIRDVEVKLVDAFGKVVRNENLGKLSRGDAHILVDL